MDLDYRAVGLTPHAADILIFFIDLTTYGLLDARQRRLLHYLTEGHSALDIARLSGASERTTQREVHRLRERVMLYLLAA